MKPKLRFNEFNDEWNKVKISSIVQELKIKTGNTEKYPLWSLTIENGVTPKTDRYERSFLVKKDDNYKIVEPNNYVYNPMNAHLGAIARNKSNTTISVSGYYDIFKINNKNYSFYDNYFVSPVMFKQYKLISTGSLLEKQRVHYSQFKELEINLPTNKEQVKISNFLSLLDKKMELQKKKIEDLKLFKKGLIKKFFNEDNLKQIKIKEIGEIVTGTTPSKSINSYWDNGNIIWVTPTDIDDNRDINDSIFKITDSGLKNGRFIPKNSILVTCIASIGKNAVLKVDGSCNQQINAIIPNKDFNYNYIYYLIESISNYMKSIAGTSATSIINKDDFSKIVVKIHSKEKQDYIASIMSQFENKIVLENSKLNKLCQLKKGFMQNMFV